MASSNTFNEERYVYLAHKWAVLYFEFSLKTGEEMSKILDEQFIEKHWVMRNHAHLDQYREVLYRNIFRKWEKHYRNTHNQIRIIRLALM